MAANLELTGRTPVFFVAASTTAGRSICAAANGRSRGAAGAPAIAAVLRVFRRDQTAGKTTPVKMGSIRRAATAEGAEVMDANSGTCLPDLSRM